MSNKLLIILAAVVVLIVIVVLTGVRYLRADDDADEFAEDREDVRDRAAGRSRSGRDARPAGHSAGAQRRDPARPDRAVAGGRPGRSAAPQAAAIDVPAGAAGGRARRHQQDGHGKTGRRTVTAVTDPPGPDRRAASGPGQRRDDRRGSRPGSDDALPAIRPRQGRGKRSDGEWPTTDWDDVSDVDFWAEVAADKPLAATAAEPADRAAAGRDPGREPARRSGRRADTASRDTVAVPRRKPARPQPGSRDVPARPAARRDSLVPVAAGDDSAVARPGPRTDVSAPSLRPDGRPGREPALAGPYALRADPARREPPASDDDDPLTSPSFPGIPAADSRSYRRHRPGRHGHPRHGPDAGATQQLSRYLAAPPDARAAGLAGDRLPAGYSDPYPSLPPAAYSGGRVSSGHADLPARAPGAGYQASARDRGTGPWPAPEPGMRSADRYGSVTGITARYSARPGGAPSAPADQVTSPYPVPGSDRAAGRPGAADGYPPAAAAVTPWQPRHGNAAAPAGGRAPVEHAETLSYGRLPAEPDVPRAAPGPATWYLGMDSAAPQAARPQRADSDRPRPRPAAGHDGSLRGAGQAADVTGGYPAGRYATSQPAPHHPGGYADADPYPGDSLGRYGYGSTAR